MPRNVVRTMLWVVATLAIAAPAAAQTVQGFQIGAGWFVPKGYDGRPINDVLVVDSNTLLFSFSDLNSGQVFGEWNLDFGKHLEFGAGIGYYRGTAPSVYRDVVNTNGAEIRQNLRLRTTPISAVVRFMPFGAPGHFQPYVGAGISATLYRYSEFGQFVDPDGNIFQTTFEHSSVAPVGMVLVGVRMPIKGDIFALMTEYRYQWGSTDSLPLDQFLSNKLDLGGQGFTFAFQVRY